MREENYIKVSHFSVPSPMKMECNKRNLGKSQIRKENRNANQDRHKGAFGEIKTLKHKQTNNLVLGCVHEKVPRN